MRYLRELNAGDPVRVTFQLLDYDAKRMHYFEQLFHADEGWVSATSENMSLHVDMAAKKTAPFPDRGRGLPRPHEGRARQAAAPGSRRPADRDAGEELTRLAIRRLRMPISGRAIRRLATAWRELAWPPAPSLDRSMAEPDDFPRDRRHVAA